MPELFLKKDLICSQPLQRDPFESGHVRVLSARNSHGDLPRPRYFLAVFTSIPDLKAATSNVSPSPKFFISFLH